VYHLGYETLVYVSFMEIYRALLRKYIVLFCGKSAGGLMVYHLGYETLVYVSFMEIYRALLRAFIGLFCG